VKVPEGDLLDH